MIGYWANETARAVYHCQVNPSNDSNNCRRGGKLKSANRVAREVRTDNEVEPRYRQNNM
jgi:hypothetical protein